MKSRIVKHSLIGILAIVILHFVFYSIRTYFFRKGISHHIEEITQSTNEMDDIIDELDNEITAKKNLMESLEKQIAIIQKSKNGKVEPLSDKGTKLLKKELEDKSHTSFWQSFLANFVFFFLGAIIAFFSGRIVTQRKLKESHHDTSGE